MLYLNLHHLIAVTDGKLQLNMDIFGYVHRVKQDTAICLTRKL